MASWIDAVSLVLTLIVVGWIVYVVRSFARYISGGIQATKENLKDKGYTISETGIEIKTSKRFNREDYIDATQRGIVKAIGASSYGKQLAAADDVPVTPKKSSFLHKMKRENSSVSSTSSKNGSGGEEEKKKKKKNLFKRGEKGSE